MKWTPLVTETVLIESYLVTYEVASVSLVNDTILIENYFQSYRVLNKDSREVNDLWNSSMAYSF